MKHPDPSEPGSGEPIRFKILHLEDNSSDANLVSELIASDGLPCEILRVSTEAEFRQRLTEGGIDVILSDHSLPAFNGIEALQIARELAPHIPFIFVSGTLGEETAVNSLRLGARDYLIKDRLSRLPASIRLALKESRETRERLAIEQQLFRKQRLESIGALAGGIAHDLNNILTPVAMACDLLETSLHDPQVNGLISIIRSSSERGSELVRQILMFAKGDDSEMVRVDLGKVISEALALIQGSYARHVAISSQVATDILPVQGNHTQLHQVLMNLCVNACDAMPAGGTLRIEAFNEFPNPASDPSAAHPSVVVRVADTGAGIPPALKQRVFDPFFTTKAPGRGTGLGLSTVASIIQRHAGSIRVESTLNRGTVFTIHLPVAPPNAAQPHNRASPAPGNGRTILVVDDDLAILEMLVATLGTYGYNVLTAIDGAKALEIVDKPGRHVDMVLTDLLMPCMNGVELALALHQRRPSLPVVCVSGASSTEIAFRIGIDHPPGSHMLRKPFSPAELLRTIEATLSR